LKGNFAFSQATSAGEDGALHTTDDQKVMRIDATNVELFVGDDGDSPDTSDDVGVRVSDGRAVFLVTSAGLAGEVEASATVYFEPGRGLVVGRVRVAINNLAVDGLPQAVEEEFVIGDTTETLSLPAGPFLRVEVSGISLEVGGQRLSGNFAFERVTTDLGPDGTVDAPGAAPNDTQVTRVEVSDVSLRLGTADRDFVVVSDGRGFLTLVGSTSSEPGGVYGDL